MIAAGMTRTATINVLGCIPQHLDALTNKLRDTA
jgi:hypothetical protein